ncbi:MAG: fibronectin type III domain-containing protein [Candidatus Brennerbacteria bacterium]|nr:fibronectin type III domain-containing protein [Candidatus Brennerbacteria bacterium]
MKNKKPFIFSFFLFLTLIFTPVAFAATANLSWNANTEPDLAGYKIYYGTSARTSSCPPGGYPDSVNAGNVTSFAVPNLTDGATYFFSITAYDITGNESCFSGEASKTFAPAVQQTTTVSTTSSIATSSAVVSSVSVSNAKFVLNSRVQTMAKLSVRNVGSLMGVSLGYQNSGAPGTVIGGPVQSGGYTWWQINYDFSPDGWSAENWLVVSTVPAPATVQNTITQTVVSTSSQTTTTTSLNTAFSIGQRIKTTAGLNVRDGASLTALKLGIQYSGSKGTIIGGPVQSGGYTWWQINYDFSPDGWSVGNWMVADTSASSVASTTSSITQQSSQTAVVSISGISKFALNQRIKTTAGLNVRDGASLTALKLGIQYSGSKGTVIGGPVQSGGYTWWQINYDFSPDGWSAENWLASF